MIGLSLFSQIYPDLPIRIDIFYPLKTRAHGFKSRELGLIREDNLSELIGYILEGRLIS